MLRFVFELIPQTNGEWSCHPALLRKCFDQCCFQLFHIVRRGWICFPGQTLRHEAVVPTSKTSSGMKARTANDFKVCSYFLSINGCDSKLLSYWPICSRKKTKQFNHDATELLKNNNRWLFIIEQY